MQITSPEQGLCLFFAYCFLGWVVEVAFHAITLGQLVNRGFLNGPVCPIYGFGMVGILLALAPVERNLVLLFLGGIAITTAIELFGGWMLFKLYHTRWWDYSNERFNFHGYICLKFSLFWGIGTLLVLKIVHPIVALGISLMPGMVRLVLLCAAAILFAVDIGVSASIAAGLDKQLQELDEIRDALRRQSDALTEKIGTTAISADEMLDEQRLQLALAKLEAREGFAEYHTEWEKQVADLRSQRRVLLDRFDQNPGWGRFVGRQRLLDAFPTALRAQEHNDVLGKLRAELAEVRRLSRK